MILCGVEYFSLQGKRDEKKLADENEDCTKIVKLRLWHSLILYSVVICMGRYRKRHARHLYTLTTSILIDLYRLMK